MQSQAARVGIDDERLLRIPARARELPLLPVVIAGADLLADTHRRRDLLGDRLGESRRRSRVAVRRDEAAGDPRAADVDHLDVGLQRRTALDE